MSYESSANGRRTTAVLLAFAMTFPTLMAWIYFKQLGASGGTANPLQQAAYFGSKVIQFALPVLWLWLLQRKIWAMRRPHFTGWPVGVGFGLVVAGSMIGLYYGYFRGSSVLADTPEKLHDKLQQFGVDTPAAYALLAA
jgi:hypothetical protein